MSTILNKIGETEHTSQNSKENYRPIPLMDTDAKVLHTILVNWTQEHFKTIYHGQLAHSVRLQSIMARKAWEEYEVAGHISSTMALGLSWLSPLYRSHSELVSLTFRACLPSLAKPFWKHRQRGVFHDDSLRRGS